MNVIKCDDKHRLRLPQLRPGDWFRPDYVSEDQVTLYRVPDPAKRPRLTREQCLAAIAKSPLRFTASFDQVKLETR